MTATSFNDIYERLYRANIRFIRFEFSDLHGIARSKKVPLSAAKGFWQAGLNVYGGTLGLDTASEIVPNTGVNEERRYADFHIIPDADTVVILPHKPDTASVICNLHDESGKALPYAPRELLRKQLNRAASLGYEVTMGHEYEFYLFHKTTLEPLFDGLHIFNTLRNEAHPAIDAILIALLAADIPVITHNAEYAGSQFEINYAPAVGLAAADRAYRFKQIVKEVADQHGLIASFMTKPSMETAGSGCHLHLSLNDLGTGENAFLDPDTVETSTDHGLSTLARQFIAGSLHHANALTAIACPTVNCYHRLRPHTFAPSQISWGIEDRSAMIRAKTSGDINTHLELRLPSAMSNPYLIATAWLIAGLDGISNRSVAPAPSVEPAEEENHWQPLPASLPIALAALADDVCFSQQLPASFQQLYQTVKRHELARFHAQVTTWERQEYLTLY